MHGACRGDTTPTLAVPPMPERERRLVRRGTPHLLTALILLLVLVLVTASGGTFASVFPTRNAPSLAATPQATPMRADTRQYEAVAPAYRREVMAAIDDRLSRYTITATLSPPGSAARSAQDATPAATPLASPAAEPAATPADVMAMPLASPQVAPQSPESAEATRYATITGRLTVQFVNPTGAPLRELPLRLYPNLRQYGEGRMVVRDIAVDGTPVTPELPPLYAVAGATPAAPPDPGSGDLLLLRIPLSRALPANGTATIAMDFTTTVPMASPDGAGQFAFTPETGTWALSQWFPMLAGYDPASGWDLEPPAAWSDPGFANTALFDVTLTAPRALVLVTTGVQVAERAEEEYRVQRFTTGPAREFTVVADDDVASTSTTVGETVVTSYYSPADAAGGAQILAWGAQALAIFAELFGPYPYAELDLVAVPGIVGSEFPQMVFIGADFYDDPVGAGSRPGAIEFLVAHEVSHQWWYGLVGNNQHEHAFLDESLAEYSAVLYFERQYGTEAAAEQVNRGLTLPYASLLLTTGDQVVDQPTAAFPNADAYYTTVSRKGALGLAALRAEMGDEAFVAGLRDYLAASRFGVASPADLRRALAQASDPALEETWRLWFESARGRVEVVMEPAPGTPAPATPVASPEATPVRAA